MAVMSPVVVSFELEDPDADEVFLTIMRALDPGAMQDYGNPVIRAQHSHTYTALREKAAALVIGLGRNSMVIRRVVSRETSNEETIATATAAHPLNKREKWHYSAEEVGLLPCPHCGPGESIVELHQDDIGYWQVGCGRCGSHSGSLPDNEHFPDAKERIIASWNKRDGVSRETLVDETIERCAKIADQGVNWEPKENFSAGALRVAAESTFLIARAIRRLKSGVSRETGGGDDPE